MLKALDVIGRFIRSLVAAVVVAMIGIAGYFGYDKFYAESRQLKEAQDKLNAREVEIKSLKQEVREGAAKIVVLNEDIKEKAKKIEKLDTSLRLLKVDQRVARLHVLKQTGSAEKGDLVTQFSFVELDSKGKPLDAPRTYSIKGDLVYLDAWVIKFKDELIESGDPEHAASIFLFRRIFGEAQQPKEGFVVDPVGSGPAPYRSDKPPTETEKELWAHFWEIANDPKQAESKGIRAAHGEAPSIKLNPGMTYRVILRASGGLSITPEEVAGEKTGPT